MEIQEKMEIQENMLAVDTVHKKFAVTLVHEGEDRWTIRWCGHATVRNAVSGTTLIPLVPDIPKRDQGLVPVRIVEKYLVDIIISLAMLRTVP